MGLEMTALFVRQDDDFANAMAGDLSC